MTNAPFIGGPDDGALLISGPSGILPCHSRRNVRLCFKPAEKFDATPIPTSVSLKEQHVYKLKDGSYVYLGVLPIGKGGK